jgi:hypothetical protein
MPTSFEVVELKSRDLKKLLALPPSGPVTVKTLKKSYFSKGSAAYCLLADGEPVFAGGIVNLQWNRGEAWITPNPFFRKNLRTCFRILKKMLPEIAARNGFRRVQAVCSIDVSGTLFRHLGFKFEGTLESFGPSGETCMMYSKIFGDAG